MKPAPIALVGSDALTADAEAWIERLCGGGEVRRELWERALFGPARDFLRRPGKRFRGRLVASSWTLAGGAGACPAELEIALELLHAGSLIVDDIEDDSCSRRGQPTLHRVVGVPLALNTGNTLYFVSLALLARVPGDAAVTASLFRHTSGALLDCHRGQALDLSARVDELVPAEVATVVEATTRLKTAALMRLGTQLAAVAAGAPDATAAALSRFGHDVGVALQMLDDLGSLTSARRLSKGREDLRGARPTWPWAWLAAEVDAAAFSELQARSRRAAGDGDLDALAQELAARIGARGRLAARGQLADAQAALSAELGDSPALRELAAELERLEGSYE